jgi:hypothetical protein
MECNKIDIYTKVYDFKKKKFINIKSKEGELLLTKYKEIYNNLNKSGKLQLNKLIEIPSNLFNNNLITNFKICKSCCYESKDENANYCGKCGKSL